MEKIFIDQWNERKHLLEEWFKSLDENKRDIRYETIVEKLFELVITEGHDYNQSKYNTDNLEVINHGDYQGTQLFIIPLDTYQPDKSDYVFLENYYGSCSGCDTLLSIIGYSDQPFNKEQVKDLMTLSLHLVQSIRFLT